MMMSWIVLEAFLMQGEIDENAQEETRIQAVRTQQPDAKHLTEEATNAPEGRKRHVVFYNVILDAK